MNTRIAEARRSFHAQQEEWNRIDRAIRQGHRPPDRQKRTLRVDLGSSGNETEIFLWGIVGLDVTAADMQDALEMAGNGPVTLRINSPGGLISEGIAIHNAIATHPASVTASIDSEACSIASVIAMGANHVRIADNGFMMIHRAHSGLFGTSEDLRREANVLDKLSDMIAMIYGRKAGKPTAAIMAAMDAETWYTAKEAKAAGLVDEIFSTMPTSGSSNSGSNRAASKTAGDASWQVAHAQRRRQLQLAEHLSK